MEKVNIDICDFHAHILPGADHGSASLNISLRQLELAKAYGVNRIVAAPHYYPDKETVESFLSRRAKAYDILSKHIPVGTFVALGAEVLICENFENLPGLEKLTIAETNVLLLELPTHHYDESFYFTVSALIERGFKIVLAHAERYDAYHIDELIELGTEIQLNVSSVSPVFYKHPDAVRWLKSGAVTAIGSDIHGTDKSHYRKFKLAIKRNLPYINKVKDKSDLLWSQFKAE